MSDVNVEQDIEALKGAAEYFEKLATMGEPSPLAFSQAIRRVIWFFTGEEAEVPKKMTYDQYIGLTDE